MADQSNLHIFLIRHQRPALSKKGWFGQKQARQFISDYDACDIEQLVSKPADLPLEHIKKVYCSSLARSKQTARAIFGPDVELIEDSAFNEFQRKIFQLPLLKFPIKVWLVGVRLLWLMGLNSKGIETFRQARARARQCAEHLARQAQTDGKVVLVAHGFLNAFIRRALKKMGWRTIRHDGESFLGVTELIKSREP